MAIKKRTILIPLASEFEVRTVFYGPSYFPATRIYGPGVKCAGQKIGAGEDEVSKMFIISLGSNRGEHLNSAI